VSSRMINRGHGEPGELPICHVVALAQADRHVFHRGVGRGRGTGRGLGVGLSRVGVGVGVGVVGVGVGVTEGVGVTVGVTVGVGVADDDGATNAYTLSSPAT
jgi:hypothetical protein